MALTWGGGRSVGRKPTRAPPPVATQHVSLEDATQAREEAVGLAEQLEHPALVQQFVRSHVSGCFWLVGTACSRMNDYPSL